MLIEQSTEEDWASASNTGLITTDGKHVAIVASGQNEIFLKVVFFSCHIYTSAVVEFCRCYQFWSGVKEANYG